MITKPSEVLAIAFHPKKLAVPGARPGDHYSPHLGKHGKFSTTLAPRV